MPPRTTHPHLAARVINTPLLIEPGKADIILSVLAPRLGLEMPAAAARTGGDAEPRALLATRGGVAVIPIHGSLVQRSGWLDAESGLTSYETIREQFNEAMADSAVSAILLDVDSPGGEVAGCFDLAAHIYAARGRKPIWAVANEMAYSAAYALASAADRLVLTRTAGVGSIGVIALHADLSGAEQQAGIKVTPIFAGDRKNDFSPHEPLSTEARSRLQTRIDQVHGIFVETVARNRGLPADRVRSTQAGLYFGSQALAAGLADEVTTFAAALGTIATAPASPPPRQQAPHAAAPVPAAADPWDAVLASLYPQTSTETLP